ncbi:MAG: hypothetical protein ACLSCV_11265 [Acutalibacteraceae bacterium]
MKLITTPCEAVVYEPQIAHALTKAEGNKDRFINVCMKNPAVRLYIMKMTGNVNTC